MWYTPTHHDTQLQMTARKAAPVSLYAYAVEGDEPPGVERVPDMPDVAYVSLETPFGRALKRIQDQAYDVYTERPARAFMENLLLLKTRVAPWFSHGVPPGTWATAADMDRDCPAVVMDGPASAGMEVRRVRASHPIAAWALGETAKQLAWELEHEPTRVSRAEFEEEEEAGYSQRTMDGVAYLYMRRYLYVTARAHVTSQLERDRAGLVRVLSDMNRVDLRRAASAEERQRFAYRPGYVGVEWSTMMACWAEARRLHEIGCFEAMPQ